MTKIPAHDNPILDSEEDDFSDLDAIIADAEAKRVADAALAGKRRKLTSRGLSDEERLRLIAEVRAVEDLYIWDDRHEVAMFHTQHCVSCDHDHRFFMGWMVLQQHKRDATCRRYTRGRSNHALPQIIEYHAQVDVELCSDCVEACLLIENAIRGGSIEAARHEMERALAKRRIPNEVDPGPELSLQQQRGHEPAQDVRPSAQGAGGGADEAKAA